MLSALVCVYKNDDIVAFQQAITSILAQTHLPQQLVLVIDGPIGEPLRRCIDDLSKNIKAQQIEYTEVALRSNVGHGLARQQGINACKHELIALADADDINLPERLQQQWQFLQHNPHIDVVGGQIIEVHHQSLQPLYKKTVPCSSEDLNAYLRRRCPFNQMTVMLRKQSVLAAGNYRHFYHNEDYDLWIRMYQQGHQFA